MDLFQVHRERLGRRIRQARVTAGLSHDRLAAQVGTSRQHLIKLEKGLHMPRPEMLSAIAEATGKPESFFASDDEEESSLPSLDMMLRDYVRRLVREEAVRS